MPRELAGMLWVLAKARFPHNRFLEDDPSVTVIERQSILRGYELYVVEQWACSRQSPTLVVATYTGDESHSIVVGVLAVPEDESLWSPTLRIYFRQLSNTMPDPRKRPSENSSLPTLVASRPPSP